MRNDEQIKESWRVVDDIDGILDAMRQHEYKAYDYLAETVAALCDVDVDIMLSDCEKLYVSQARALFWYAFRYMTNETYEKIALMTKRKHSFARVSVGQSINKMSALIEKEPIWNKRWTIIKRIIKLRDASSEEPLDNTIVIKVPRHLKERIKFEIKER